MGIRFLALALTASAACVSSPSVPDPGEAQEPVPLYPDVLLNTTIAGEFDVCREELPPCQEPIDSACLPADKMPVSLDALGPPDDVPFVFDADGRLDVGFHCGAITEAGLLTIHSTQAEDDSADVFVSLDGIEYIWVGELRSDMNQFNLTTYEVHAARYVRVLDTGAGGTSIDAIEGLWNGGEP